MTVEACPRARLIAEVPGPDPGDRVYPVRLLAVTGTTLDVAGLDLADGTPVLDIKPYVPEFDAVAAERTGWLQAAAARVHRVRADARFDSR